MEKLHELYDIAEEEQIQTCHSKLPESVSGLYIETDESRYIVINKRITPDSKEETCILAEELGHHYTSAGNLLDVNELYNKRIQVSKQEKRARKWAFERLVPLKSLIIAYEAGAKNRHDLAEALDVTEEFLGHAIEQYREKYGKFLEVERKWLVYFEPFGVGKIKI